MLKVRELAQIARSDYLAKQKESSPDSDTSVMDMSLIEDADYYEERRNSPLFRFLNELSDEQVKVVQTVMYIGRDHEVPAPSDEEMEMYFVRKADDPYYELPKPQLRVDNPDEYLSEMIALFGKSKGWKDKSIEINTIMEKLMKLSDYLSRGFKILGVE